MHSDRPSPPDPPLRRTERPPATKSQAADQLSPDATTSGAQLSHLNLHQIELELQHDELKKAYRREEAARLRYRELYDFAPLGYLSLTADGLIIETNLTAARILGRERARLSWQSFAAYVDPSHRAVFLDFQTKILTTDPPASCTVALLTGDSFTGGERRRIVQLEGSRSADGVECRVAMIDCTARVQAEEELKRTQARLREHEMNELMHVNRLAALGTVMAGLVHEFNHPAQVVILNQKSLRSMVQCCVDEARKHHGPALGMLSWEEIATMAPALLTDIERASAHLNELIVSVQSYAQPREDSRETPDMADLSGAARAALQLVTSYARRCQVQIASDLGRASPHHQPSHSRLQQILINLLLNAIQASPVGGTVRLVCELREGCPVARISDDGPGIDAAILGRLGEPFITSRSASGGSGLGLSICFSLLATMNGRLDFAARQPHGTLVTLAFPAVPRT
jgi:signal transduction histidine kinase